MENANTIIMKPMTNAIDEFDKLYKFLSGQILDEIARKKIIRKITNDTTPVVVEDSLQQAIMTTLNRFELYDRQIKVGCGFAIYIDPSISNIPIETTRFEIEKYTNSLYPYTVFLKYSDSISKKIKCDDVEQLTKLVNGIDPSVYRDIEDIYDTYHSFDLVMRDYIQEDLDHIRMKTKSSFFHSNSVELKIDIFAVEKNSSNNQIMRDINITTESVVEMLWGDLIDKAIEIESLND